MRAGRLLAILIRLQVRGRSTADALARELGVSVRTVYRDVDELSSAGVPVYAERGANGGFRLHDGYRTDLTGLSEHEAEALWLAALPDAAASLGLAGIAATVRLKLLAALPERARRSAARVGGRLHVDAVPWYRRPPRAPHLRDVATAVWSEQRLRIDYESWTRRGWRTVDPLGLVIKSGEWYLVARARDRCTVYRLAMVHGVETLRESFTRPANFDLANAWRDHVAAFEKSLENGTATLRVSPQALLRVGVLGAGIEAAVRAAVPGKDDWRVAEVPIESVPHAAALLLGFADSIEVVAPAALRDELRARAASIVALYGARRIARAVPRGTEPRDREREDRPE